VSDDNRIVAVGEEARDMIGRTPCVALGTGLALEHFDFFKKSFVQQV
jgi:hypothetical protein